MADMDSKRADLRMTAAYYDGLAGLGYEVAASDISGAAIECAREEAAKRGLDIEYCVAMSTLERLLAEAGFARTVVLRERFFQPIIVGVR